MKRLYSLILLMLFVAVIGACGGGDAEPTPTAEPPTATAAPTEPPADPTATAEPETETDEASSALDSPLPAPVSPLPAPVSPLPEPDAEQSRSAAPDVPDLPPAPEVELTEATGAVTGVIIAKGSDGNYKPLANITIGLGDLVEDDATNEAIAAAYDPRESVRTTTDLSGRFVLNGVLPNESGYGLILDSVINAVLLSYPAGHENGNGSIIFNIEANELLDLGELKYDTLPLYGFTN